MSLVPSVTELILAELLYLQFEDAQKPIYLYINRRACHLSSH
jgi:ATP-dependent Clp protease protease subunit